MNTTVEPASLTMPDVAEKIGLRIDRLRSILRSRPDLAAMLAKIGPFRVLPAAKLDEFRAALEAPGYQGPPEHSREGLSGT